MAQPQPVAQPSIDLHSEARFINRELSWLAFNERVISEAENPGHPLLERLRFLSISASNLDEFYMVRVAGLKGQVLAGVATASQDGLTPAQQLAAINQRARKLMLDQQEIWRSLRQQLHDADFTVIGPQDLSAEDRAWVEAAFMAHVFPVLTPLAIDPAHPFPFIANRGIGLALQLTRSGDGKRMQALMLLPGAIGRFIRMPGTAVRFLPLEQMVTLFLDRHVPGLLGGGAGHVPHRAGQRDGNRGRGRGSRAAVRERPQAAPARQRDLARGRRRDAGGSAALPGGESRRLRRTTCSCSTA